MQLTKSTNTEKYNKVKVFNVLPSISFAGNFGSTMCGWAKDRVRVCQTILCSKNFATSSFQKFYVGGYFYCLLAFSCFSISIWLWCGRTRFSEGRYKLPTKGTKNIEILQFIIANNCFTLLPPKLILVNSQTALLTPKYIQTKFTN